MSVINWAEKSYPWNEIGPEWVAKLQKLVEKPVESRTVQEPEGAATLLRESVYVPQTEHLTFLINRNGAPYTPSSIRGALLRRHTPKARANGARGMEEGTDGQLSRLRQRY